MLRCTCFFILFWTPYQVLAQIVGDNIFLKGKSIEIGIDDTGAFGSDTAAPAGYHPRFPGPLGFVADPVGDGWSVGTPNYFGDYFLPGGIAHEGWSLSINGYVNRAWRSTLGTTFSAPLFVPVILTGTNTEYTLSGSEIQAVWEGTMGDLAIKQTTTLDTNAFFFIVDVTIKNTGTTPAVNVFYERSVDPENELDLTPWDVLGWVHMLIRYEPTFSPSHDYRCLVESHGSVYPSLSYMGLGTVDCRAQAFILPVMVYAPNIALELLHAGTTGSGLPATTFEHEVGDSVYRNSGCGIVFNLGTIEAGDSTALSYTYILNRDFIDSSFTALATGWLIDGTVYTTVEDTVRYMVCEGADSLDVSIFRGDEFEWGVWSPTIGIAYPSGRFNRVAVPDTPITYRVIGTTPLCPVSDTIYLTIIPGGDTVVSNEEICSGGSYDFFGTSLSTAGTYYYTDTSGYCDFVWSLVLTMTDTIRSYSTVTLCDGDSFNWSGVSYNTAGTYSLYGVNAMGCDTLHTLTINVLTVDTISLMKSICSGESYDFFGDSLSIGGTYYYTDGPCDTAWVLHLEVLPYLYGDRVVDLCEGDSYLFNGITYTSSISGVTDTITNPSFCDSIVTLELTIYPLPNVNIDLVNSIAGHCIYDTVQLVADGALNYYWAVDDGQHYSGSPIDIMLTRSENLITVTGVDENGCMDTAETFVRADACCELSMPSAFSPNNDGLNDIFRPIALGTPIEYRFGVFDRWGQRIFVSFKIGDGWDGTFDGKKAEPGTYFYQITGKCADGSDIYLKGDVTLLR